jgi:hypothetical protein
MLHRICVEKDQLGYWQANFEDLPNVRSVGNEPKQAIQAIVDLTPEMGVDLCTIHACESDSTSRLYFTVEGPDR